MGYQKRLAKAERNNVARVRGHYPYRIDNMAETKGGSKIGPGMKRAAERMEGARERNHTASQSRHTLLSKKPAKTRQQLRAIARTAKKEHRVTPAEAGRRSMATLNGPHRS